MDDAATDVDDVIACDDVDDVTACVVVDDVIDAVPILLAGVVQTFTPSSALSAGVHCPPINSIKAACEAAELPETQGVADTTISFVTDKHTSQAEEGLVFELNDAGGAVLAAT
jgi:hypothetical protein